MRVAVTDVAQVRGRPLSWFWAAPICTTCDR